MGTGKTVRQVGPSTTSAGTAAAGRRKQPLESQKRLIRAAA